MAKLYAPYIDGKIPAFAGSLLKIPFQLNRAVGRQDFDYVMLMMKTIATNTILVQNLPSTLIEYDIDNKNWIAVFDLSNQPLIIGQFYKIQIAFASFKEQLNTSAILDYEDGAELDIMLLDTAEDTRVYDVGYYSETATVKYTAMPNLMIEKLDASKTNYHQYTYTGVYDQTLEHGDKSEKVYSYRFDLYDEESNLITSSGDIIHNSSLDVEKFKSSDTWTLNKDLNKNIQYQLVYNVKTMNGLEVATPSYRIMQVDTVDLELAADLSAELYEEDGYVEIRLIAYSDANPVRGSFILSRASDKDNFETWNEIYKFNLANEQPNKMLWRDFTVWQGRTYKYAIQAYNTNNFYSNRLENIEGAVEVDFEHMYLYDGERQLKIKYNPKITSFKATRLETKTDTIGGQYPFIFRNGRVNYKEFPVGGLISLLSDENELFMNGLQHKDLLERQETAAAVKRIYDADTALTGDNVRREREFKLEVLDWLTNGKPKLFRSGPEGNYIVRLMNVQLQPNDTVGRMIHSFTATAYEVGNCSFDNLASLGFIQVPTTEYRDMKFGSELMKDIFIKPGQTYQFESGAYFLTFTNQFTDNLIVELEFLNDQIKTQINVANVTGHYKVKVENNPVVKVTYLAGAINNDAYMTFGYYDTSTTNDFSYITNIILEDRIESYVGSEVEYAGQKGISVNLIDHVIEDIRTQTGRFYYIRLTPRRMQTIYVNIGNQYFEDPEGKREIAIWDNSKIYEVYQIDTSVFKGWKYGEQVDLVNVAPDYRIQLNNTYYTDLAPTNNNTAGQFVIKDVDKVEQLRIGTGVIADLVYQVKYIEYTVESEDALTRYWKKAWLENIGTDHEQHYYNKYIEYLELALKAQKAGGNYVF